jgi:hypothetical protein
MRKIEKENKTLKAENIRLQQQVDALTSTSFPQYNPTQYSPPPKQQISPQNIPVFSVQIKASKSKLSNMEMTFSTLSLRGERIIEEYYSDDPLGFPFKYVVGEFYEMEDAIRYRNYINNQNIISGAFVVAYYNDKRIPIKQALEIIERTRKY